MTRTKARATLLEPAQAYRKPLLHASAAFVSRHQTDLNVPGDEPSQQQAAHGRKPQPALILSDNRQLVASQKPGKSPLQTLRAVRYSPVRTHNPEVLTAHGAKRTGAATHSATSLRAIYSTRKPRVHIPAEPQQTRRAKRPSATWRSAADHVHHVHRSKVFELTERQTQSPGRALSWTGRSARDTQTHTQTCLP